MKMLLLTLFVALVASAPVEYSKNGVNVIFTELHERPALEVVQIVDFTLTDQADCQAATGTAAEVKAQSVEVVDAVGSDVLVQVVVDSSPMDLSYSVVPEVLSEPVVPKAAAFEIASPVLEPAVLPKAAAFKVLQPVSKPAVPSKAVAPKAVPVPSPVVLPEPVAPEVPPTTVVLRKHMDAKVVPSPAVVPISEVFLKPVAPKVVPTPIVTPEALPVPEHQAAEVYSLVEKMPEVFTTNDGGIVSTLQSWYKNIMNYFNSGSDNSDRQI